MNLKLLNNIIKESGLKKKFIAEKIWLTEVSFRNKLIGKTEFKISEVLMLQDVLNFSNKTRDDIFFS